MIEAMLRLGPASAEAAESYGLGADRIILSAKVSGVRDLWDVYTPPGRALRYALHLGLTEAGMGPRGIVASTAALAPLLAEGIGDTIRVSLTPEPGAPRALEVEVAQLVLQSMDCAPSRRGHRLPRLRTHDVHALSGARQQVEASCVSSMPVWREQYPGAERLRVAVMGCVVNGPGESKHADIGISLPGTGEAPRAPVYIDGKKFTTLEGPTLAADFMQLVEDYVARRFGS
jgi:(E)-4-hydroxy-3-methylbut-2-enyl-diphosphate synthase